MNWLERFLLPPHCQLCGASAEQDELCASCAAEAHPIQNACPLCALPNDDNSVCSHCTLSPPIWQKAHSCFVYDGTISQLMRYWKYAKKRSAERLLCEAFAHWIKAVKLTSEATAIIAVPMHPKKLGQRGFNTAYQLAQQASQQLKLPLLDKALIRNRQTHSQAGLDKVARQQNLRGVFRVDEQALHHHHRILLIDDVYTTGSTAQAAGQLLQAAGVKHLHLLTLARALPPKHERSVGARETDIQSTVS